MDAGQDATKVTSGEGNQTVCRAARDRFNNPNCMEGAVLVLKVPVNGSVQVGDNVTIHNFGKCDARIGVDAPPDVRIVRSNAVNKQPNSDSPGSEDYCDE